MKHVSLLTLLLAFAGCTDIPELEGKEAPSIRNAAYPKLVPLEETLGTPVDPVSEASEVEEELTSRSEELAKKAAALQAAEIN
ncbi:hypothetical protein [Roseibium sp. RKSG952]|uniref:hypothetical protein n=1 Tax=Roseibium sp. RKSG952 TaxID=2529384 RepID=UPI0012BC6AA0|nr:hypothetical protein [Roseibium sp. RKSG952]MTH95667.1 hypothetical protein [Roseibium sp. RKSG952]